MHEHDGQLTTTGGEAIAPQECYLAAPGGIKINVSPETGAIIPPGNSPAEIRAWIHRLAMTMLADPSGHNDFPLKHTFLHGIYIREMFIPKGTLLIGKIHKLDCMNVVSSGDISVLTELGSARVGAGYSSVSPAGIQKVGYAHDDTVFVNIFRTDETDLGKIEQAIAFDDLASAESIEMQTMEKITCQ